MDDHDSTLREPHKWCHIRRHIRSILLRKVERHKGVLSWCLDIIVNNIASTKPALEPREFV